MSLNYSDMEPTTRLRGRCVVGEYERLVKKVVLSGSKSILKGKTFWYTFDILLSFAKIIIF